MHLNDREKGLLSGLLAGAMWGLVFLVPKILPGFSPIELALGRYIAYGFLSFFVSVPFLRKMLKKLSFLSVKALIFQAITGNVFYYVMLSVGVQNVGISATSLVIGLVPLTVTFAGRNDHGSKSLRTLIFPLLCIFLGILAINADVFFKPSEVQSLKDRALGICAALFALLSWTFYAVHNARFLRKHPEFGVEEWSALYGMMSGLLSLFFWGFFFILVKSKQSETDVHAPWASFWMINTSVAIFSSLLANGLWNIAAKKLPLTLSAQLIVSETLFALFYGFLFDRRFPTFLEIVACVFMLLGVLWTVSLHKAKEDF